MLSRFVLVAIALVSVVIPAEAAVVPRDMLGGIGEFSNSCYTSWVSSYGGSDYDWNAPGRWSYGPKHAGGAPWRFGTNLATPDDSVAEGWSRESNLNPDSSLIYRLVDNAGGKCQYFAIRNLPRGYGSAYVSTRFEVGTEPYKLNPGDVVTFRIDSIRMDDCDASGLTYQLVLDGVNGSPSYQNLPPAVTTYSSSVTGTVSSGAKEVVAKVRIIASDGVGTHTPGICVDGAHLTIRRGGSQLTEEVPVRKSRSVKSTQCFVTSHDDPYSLARNYDRVNLKEENDYWFARRLKYYNPGIRVFFWAGPWVADWREPGYGNRDPLASNTPIGMARVLAHDAKPGNKPWLYSNGDTWFGVDPTHPNVYYAHIDDAAFQQEWILNAFAKVAKYRLDGLFIDGSAVATPSGGFPGIQPWEEQSFLHAVMNKRPSGIEVVHNMCAANLLKGFNPSARDPGRRWLEQVFVSFDPTWVPPATGEYTAANHYTANSADNTIDGMYQEYAFFKHGGGRNWYGATYTQDCLNDMDQVAAWNAKLPANRAKWMHCQAYGDDRADDPARGIDGWLNFGLCCYLLGQNDWTTVGFSMKTGSERTYPTSQLDETANLGRPAGDRVMTGNMGERRYYGSDEGAKGGVIVANTDPASSSSFVPGFDLIDQNSVFHPAGVAIPLGPHTGRILYHQNSYKYVTAVTSPVEGQTISSAACQIRGRVVANRPGLALPSTAQVRIDSGPWIDCPVATDGSWSLSVTSLAPGPHTVGSRVCVSAGDCEPDKRERRFVVAGHLRPN